MVTGLLNCNFGGVGFRMGERCDINFGFLSNLDFGVLGVCSGAATLPIGIHYWNIITSILT
jgi:hypothetical protein